MPKIYAGSTQIKKIYAGSTQIKKIYAGSTLVYSAENVLFSNNSSSAGSVSSWQCGAYGVASIGTGDPAWSTTTISTGSTGNMTRYNGNIRGTTGLKSGAMYLSTNHSTIGYVPLKIRSGSTVNCTGFTTLSVTYTHSGTNLGSYPKIGFSTDSNLQFLSSLPTLTASVNFTASGATLTTNVSSVGSGKYLYIVFIGNAGEINEEEYDITNIKLT